jgi:hypothetical protein
MDKINLNKIKIKKKKKEDKAKKEKNILKKLETEGPEEKKDELLKLYKESMIK